jgi:hypothetical protein
MIGPILVIIVRYYLFNFISKLTQNPLFFKKCSAINNFKIMYDRHRTLGYGCSHF